MFKLMHVNGCGKPAFLMTAVPLPYSLLTHERVRHLDGSAMKSTDRVMCESCGRDLSGTDFASKFFVKDDPDAQTNG
jgi:hypothetical protein